MKAPSTDEKQRRKMPFWSRRASKPPIKTIVIDTSSLVHYSEVTVVPQPSIGDAAHLTEAAARALVGATQLPLTKIRESLPAVRVHPVAMHAGTITGASWHQGTIYTSYWIGSPEDVIQRSDLTESEREQLLATVRKLSAQGKLSYCVATSQTTQTKESESAAIKPHNLDFIGIISHDIQLHVDTERALIACAKNDITIIYASSDNESIVAAVAHKAKLLAAHDLPHAFTPGIQITHGAVAYARMNDHAKQQLLSALDQHTTLITSEPLPAVVRSLTAK